jgi:hypothetical protein
MGMFSFCSKMRLASTNFISLIAAYDRQIANGDFCTEIHCHEVLRPVTARLRDCVSTGLPDISIVARRASV